MDTQSSTTPEGETGSIEHGLAYPHVRQRSNENWTISLMKQRSSQVPGTTGRSTLLGSIIANAIGSACHRNYSKPTVLPLRDSAQPLDSEHIII